MSRRRRDFYFPVYWNSEDQRWYVDNASWENFFPDGTLWDEDEQRWRLPDQGFEEDLDQDLYEELLTMFAKNDDPDYGVN